MDNRGGINNDPAVITKMRWLWQLQLGSMAYFITRIFFISLFGTSSQHPQDHQIFSNLSFPSSPSFHSSLVLPDLLNPPSLCADPLCAHSSLCVGVNTSPPMPFTTHLVMGFLRGHSTPRTRLRSHSAAVCMSAVLEREKSRALVARDFSPNAGVSAPSPTPLTY